MVGATFRLLAVILLLCCMDHPLDAFAQGGIPTPRQQAPHRCDNFDHCLERCNANGGTGGTDIGCARLCSGRNCINNPDKADAGGRATMKKAGGGLRSGGSCKQALDKCKANCVSKS
jgi:hypothetical protein